MSGESDIEVESSLYKTVEFRMYCFKVLTPLGSNADLRLRY